MGAFSDALEGIARRGGVPAARTASEYAADDAPLPGGDDNNTLFNFLRFVSRPYYGVTSLLAGDLEGAAKNVGQLALDLPTLGLTRNYSLANLLPDSWLGEVGDLTTRKQRREATDVLREHELSDVGGFGRGLGENLGAFGIDLAAGVALDPLSWISGGTLGTLRQTLMGMKRAPAALKVVNSFSKTDKGLDALREAHRALPDHISRRPFEEALEDFGVEIGEQASRAVGGLGEGFQFGASSSYRLGDELGATGDRVADYDRLIDAMKRQEVEVPNPLRFMGRKVADEGFYRKLWDNATLPGLSMKMLRAGAEASDNPASLAKILTRGFDDMHTSMLNKFWDKRSVFGGLPRSVKLAAIRQSTKNTARNVESDRVVGELWDGFSREAQDGVGELLAKASDDLYKLDLEDAVNPATGVGYTRDELLDAEALAWRDVRRQATTQFGEFQSPEGAEKLRHAMRAYGNRMRSIGEDLHRAGVWGDPQGRRLYIPHQAQPYLEAFLAERVGGGQAYRDVYTKSRELDLPEYQAWLRGQAEKAGLGVDEGAQLVNIRDLHLKREKAHNWTMLAQGLKGDMEEILGAGVFESVPAARREEWASSWEDAARKAGASAARLDRWERAAAPYKKAARVLRQKLDLLGKPTDQPPREFVPSGVTRAFDPTKLEVTGYGRVALAAGPQRGTGPTTFGRSPSLPSGPLPFAHQAPGRPEFATRLGSVMRANMEAAEAFPPMHVPLNPVVSDVLARVDPDEAGGFLILTPNVLDAQRRILGGESSKGLLGSIRSAAEKAKVDLPLSDDALLEAILRRPLALPSRMPKEALWHSLRRDAQAVEDAIHGIRRDVGHVRADELRQYIPSEARLARGDLNELHAAALRRGVDDEIRQALGKEAALRSLHDDARRVRAQVAAAREVWRLADDAMVAAGRNMSRGGDLASVVTRDIRMAEDYARRGAPPPPKPKPKPKAKLVGYTPLGAKKGPKPKPGPKTLAQRLNEAAAAEEEAYVALTNLQSRYLPMWEKIIRTERERRLDLSRLREILARPEYRPIPPGGFVDQAIKRSVELKAQHTDLTRRLAAAEGVVARLGAKADDARRMLANDVADRDHWSDVAERYISKADEPHLRAGREPPARDPWGRLIKSEFNENALKYLQRQIKGVGARGPLTRWLGGGVYKVSMEGATNAEKVAFAKTRPDDLFLREGEVYARSRGVNYYYRPALTSLNPAHHVRNNVASTLQAALHPDIGPIAGGKAFFNAILELPIVQRLPRWKESESRLFLRAIRGDAAATRDLAGTKIGNERAEDVAEYLSGMLGDRPNRSDLQRSFDNLSPGSGSVLGSMRQMYEGMVRFGEDVGSAVEGVHRATAFLKLIRSKKHSLEEAVEAVERTFVAYHVNSAVERAVRDTFLFSRFTMGSLAWAQSFARRPQSVFAGGTGARDVQTISSQLRRSDDDEPVPRQVRGTLGFPMGTDEEGATRYMTSFGSPFEATSQAIDVAAWPGFRERGLSTLSPPLRFPLEMATDTSFRFGGQFGRDRRLRSLGLIGFEGTVPGVLSELVAASPAARFNQTADTLLDERDPVGSRWVEALTGIRTHRVQSVEAMLRMGEEELRKKGIDPERLPSVRRSRAFDAETQELLKNYRKVRRRKRRQE